MPELPEVETIVRQLRERIVHQIIQKVEILRPSQWKRNDPQLINQTLKSKHISEIKRRAKFVIIDFSDKSQLVVHLRMTGKLIWSNGEPVIDKFTRTIFYFESGCSLQFNDIRALGTLMFLKSSERDHWQEDLGLEPLSEQWTLERLTRLIRKSGLDMKSFLLDQKKIAGIGNIYASEILFKSRIHPERRANTLSDEEILRLFKAVPQILQLAVDKMGTSLGDGAANYRSVYNIEGGFQKILMVYGREGESCRQCGSPIFRIKQKGRSSYFCEKCQI